MSESSCPERLGGPITVSGHLTAYFQNQELLDKIMNQNPCAEVTLPGGKSLEYKLDDGTVMTFKTLKTEDEKELIELLHDDLERSTMESYFRKSDHAIDYFTYLDQDGNQREISREAIYQDPELSRRMNFPPRRSYAVDEIIGRKVDVLIVDEIDQNPVSVMKDAMRDYQKKLLEPIVSHLVKSAADSIIDMVTHRPSGKSMMVEQMKSRLQRPGVTPELRYVSLDEMEDLCDQTLEKKFQPLDLKKSKREDAAMAFGLLYGAGDRKSSQISFMTADLKKALLAAQRPKGKDRYQAQIPNQNHREKLQARRQELIKKMKTRIEEVKVQIGDLTPEQLAEDEMTTKDLQC